LFPKVYGVRILDGSLKASDTVRVSRDGETLGEAKLTSLRHFKEQVGSSLFDLPRFNFLYL
jgi:translation initiation factor IF-2